MAQEKADVKQLADRDLKHIVGRHETIVSLMKHVGTISSGAILLVASQVDRVGKLSGLQFFRVALVGFCASVAASAVCMFFTAIRYGESQEEYTRRIGNEAKRSELYWALWMGIALAGLLLGVACIAIFGWLNV